MSFSAVMIEDSISPRGHRMSTMVWKYPRFIHAELMTHRKLSRNASSSRAIPVKTLVQAALDDPAFFVHVGKNVPGMQAKEEVDEEIKAKFKAEWEELARISSEYALRWANEYGVHKQVVNRVMEPWHHISVVVSSTDYDNLWNLRCHLDAQPEFQVQAIIARSARDSSVPKLLRPGEWHLPFVTEEERGILPLEICLKLSTARCARVSYLTHDRQDPNVGKDISLYDQLVGSVPIHASPTEHQATPDDRRLGCLWWKNGRKHGNLDGWVQHRKLVEERIWRAA